MSTISLMNNGKWLPFYLPLAKAFKDNDTAIFLSKLVNKYEFHKNRDEIEEDGWFFATVDQIEEDINLSVYQQKRVIKKLKTVGFIDMKLMGMPSKRYFKLYIPQIESFLTTGCLPSFIQEKLSIKIERNSRSDTRETLDQDQEKLMTSNNTVIITQSTKTHNENTGEIFSRKEEIEALEKAFQSFTGLNTFCETKPSTEGASDRVAIGREVIEQTTSRSNTSRAKRAKKVKEFQGMSSKVQDQLIVCKDLYPEWERWLKYKFDVFDFQYYDEKSELKALTELVNLSGKKESKAVEIIELAICNKWRGFHLPNPKNVQNGQTRKDGLTKNTARFRNEFILEYNQQRGCEPSEEELTLAIAHYERQF